MATLGTDTVEVVLPSGVSSDSVAVTTGPDGASQIEVAAPVEELEITAESGTTELSGAKMSESEVLATPKKGETATVVVESTVFKGNTITNEGKGSLEVTVATGSFKKSGIEGGKAADAVSFGASVSIKSATVDLGKGDDSITFAKGVKIKGNTTLDLGKGGKDVVTFESAKDAKKITITNITKKDKFIVGDDTYKGKDILNGADVPFKIG